MSRDPFDGLDDGDIYGSSGVADSDSSGATRIQRPGFIRPGVPLKPVPKGEYEHLGTYGRAPVDVDRPVVPTPLDFDPRISAPIGVAPTRFDHDPRSDIGTSTDIQPAHVVLARLKVKGAEPYMLQWIHGRARRGILTSPEIIDQCRLLHYYGDGLAGQVAQYAMQTNAFLANQQQRVQQDVARRIGVRR